MALWPPAHLPAGGGQLTAQAARPEAWQEWPAAERLVLFRRLIAEKYWTEPVGWIRAFVRFPEGEHLTPYQARMAAEIPLRKRVSARGPRGLGKTTTVALVLLWFSWTREAAGKDWKAPTTAGNWRQLQRFLWPEVHKWARRVDWDALGDAPWREGRELLDMAIQLPHGQAFAIASNDAEKMEGAHADHVLFVFDEAKIVPDSTFDAAEGTLAGAGVRGREAYALAFSTPGEPNGRFYEIHRRKAGLEDWYVIVVSLAEAVAAGQVAPDWSEQRRKQWGETSALYQNHVLGNFASADEDATIPLTWVEAAMDRWDELQERLAAGTAELPPLTCVGADIAGSGSDRTVFALRHTRVLAELRKYSHKDTMEVAGLLGGILAANRGAYGVPDAIGMGAGPVDRLREQGHDIEAFVASEGTDEVDASGELGFTNRRSLAWWHMRELLDPAHELNVCLVRDDDLLGDLTTPKYRVMSGARIQIEAKVEIKKRLGRSTDDGDACVMAFCPRAPQGGTLEYTERVDISPDI